MTGSDFHIRRLAIIGVGLIGGSLARALRDAGCVDQVVGCSRRRETLDRATDLGVIDEGFTSVNAAVGEADVTVIATPVGAMGSVFAAVADAMPPSAVITDAGSVKGEVVAEARRAFGQHLGRFVPGHPIAGTERSGVAASFATLFDGRRTVLTPLPETDHDALGRVRAMWQAAGSVVSEMSVTDHDRILAATSHLPHVLAYALVEFMAAQPDGPRHFELAAGGFYDFTRIASSDPLMWRDICLANRAELVPVLRGFARRLDELIVDIDGGDGESLIRAFGNAKHERDRHLPQTWKGKGS